MDTSPPSRRWWKRLPARLSVRALMVLVLVIGGGFGWVVHPARVQREAVSSIKRAGGVVGYDLASRERFCRLYARKGEKLPWAQRPWPRWLVDPIGVDYFYSVISVEFPAHAHASDAELVYVRDLSNIECLHLSGSDVTGAGLVHLKGIIGLKCLTLDDSHVTDAGLVHLKGLIGLKCLTLCDSHVTDAGLRHLEGLTRLETLLLTGTAVCDVGLPSLGKLKRLKYLNLYGAQVISGDRSTRVTYSGIRELKRALPNALIYPTLNDFEEHRSEATNAMPPKEP
jgi:hypothetical protein